MNRIEKVQLSHGLSDYWEAFIDFLLDQKLPGVTNIDEIISVCKKIEKDFSGIKRKTGEDYVAHLYEVTRLYITLHGEKISQKRVIISLLHDNIEDLSPEEYEEIKTLYGEEIAFCVKILSKDPLKEGENRAERNREYVEKFWTISQLKSYIRKKAGEQWLQIGKSKARTLALMLAAIKISDRAHNLITLDLEYFTLEQIERKIQETEDFIIPLALSIGNIFLVDILRKELIKLNMRIHKEKSKEILN